MIADAHFRHVGGKREAMTAPGQVASIAANYTPSQQHWGKITSRQPPAYSREAIELLAFRMGCKPASLVRAINLGLFNG